MTKSILKHFLNLIFLLIAVVQPLSAQSNNCSDIFLAQATTCNANNTMYDCILVDGSDWGQNGRNIVIESGTYHYARFTNLRGEANCPFIIEAAQGGVTFEGGVRSTVILENCKFVELRGGKTSNTQILITDAVEGQQGLSVEGDCSNINIHHLAISAPNAFAGIMIKNSPLCNENQATGYCGELNSDNEEIYMHDIYIHHNRIENVKGEGIYVGDTKFLFPYMCDDINYYRQRIENVEIAYNIISNTGYDGIQLGSCTTGGSIYNNTIINYGDKNKNGQANGIQIGLGTQGATCYNNFIYKENPISHGHGIFSQGAGNNCIINNIISHTAENGIYINESTVYRPHQPDGFCTKLKLNPKKVPTGVFHNTIVYPNRSKKYSMTSGGIRLAYTTGNSNSMETITDVFNHPIENNLIVTAQQNTPSVYFDSSLPPHTGCLNNVVKNGITDLSSIFTYVNGPSSSISYYPQSTLSEVVNSAGMPLCDKKCGTKKDFFGNDRPNGNLSEYGAIEIKKQ